MGYVPLPPLLKLGTKETKGFHQYRLVGRPPGIEETMAFAGEAA